jgi:cytochrome c oxidase subunit 2
MKVKSTLAVLATAVTLLAGGTGCEHPGHALATVTSSAADADGDQLYVDYCQQCHGVDGEGNDGVGAPSIAGLPEWYLGRQVHKFKDGVRGTHFDDIMGMKMRPMALTLTNDGQVDRIAAYVAKMPVVKNAATLDGDADRGKAGFGTCVACHQADGTGMQALNAPPISQADDWYLLTQLSNFKHGIRGAHADDVEGAQMAPMAKLLADEQAMKDVIAYMRTLK